MKKFLVFFSAIIFFGTAPLLADESDSLTLSDFVGIWVTQVEGKEAVSIYEENGFLTFKIHGQEVSGLCDEFTRTKENGARTEKFLIVCQAGAETGSFIRFVNKDVVILRNVGTEGSFTLHRKIQ